jgi:hypothetical protein
LEESNSIYRKEKGRMKLILIVVWRSIRSAAFFESSAENPDLFY